MVFNEKAFNLYFFSFIVKVFEGVLRDGFKIDIKDGLKGMDNLTIEQMFTWVLILQGYNYFTHSNTVKSFNFMGIKFHGLTTLDMYMDT